MTSIPTEIAAIAKGLSKAMQSMLLWSRPGWREPPRCYGRGVTKKALRERGLGSGDFCYLTPLGLAVRAHLQQADAQPKEPS